jgi:putative ABC transport system permease protein
MSAFLKDLRYALRQLRKSPGFAALAIVTLALGIGANTAMFTVIDAVLLRPLPFPSADRVMAISTGAPGQGPGTTSWPDYTDLRDQSHSLELVAGYFPDVAVVNTSQGSQDVASAKATANLLDLLGVRPVLGRAFLPSDNQPGAPPVVILSAGLWRQQFAADPHILGRQIRIGGVAHTVIGVMPADIPFPQNQSDMATGVWLPFQLTPDTLQDRGSSWLYMIGRLKPGVRRQAAQTEAAAIAQRIRKQYPENDSKLSFTLQPYQDVITASVRPVLLALTGALLLVLLIACVNVANLLLARCLARRQEMAVRAALGASRPQLVRQMLAEGAVLASAGALAGLALASLLIQAVHRLPPGLVPRAEGVHLRVPVFLMLVAFAVLSTVLSSLAPALVAMRTDADEALREAARGLSAGPKRSRLAAWMVSGEVALSAVLLVATGLTFRTLYNLEHVHLGFDVKRVSSFMAVPANSAGFVSFSQSQDQESVATRIYGPILERLRHLPGMLDAALTSGPPLAHFDMNTDFAIEGRPQSKHEREQQNRALLRVLSGGYARLMGATMVEGRAITDDDTASAPFVTVINETFARRYFAGQNPLGQRINLGGKDTGMLQPYTIVGVVGDAVQLELSQPARPEIDLPYQQIPVTSAYYPMMLAGATHYLVKTQADIDLTNTVRQVFRQYAPDYALDNFQTLSAAIDDATFNQRLGLYLIGSFAAIAVVMVLAGLYGVLSQLVGQRRREIGVRLALGATRGSILRLILRQGSLLIAVGLVAGLVASQAAGRLLRSFLYGVEPTDMVTYLAVALLLVAVGLVAGLLPAQRASHIDPMTALRCE